MKDAASTRSSGRPAAPPRRGLPAWCRPEYFFYYFGTAVFTLLGLHRRGWRNAHAIEPRDLAWPIPDLPAGLAGLKVLLVSDLHLDGPSTTTERLLDLLPSLPADLALLGGDYQWHTFGASVRAAEELRRLVPVLRRPLGLYGVLGNHDDPSFVFPMRDMGIRTLVNEAACVSRDGAELWLAGIEDSYYWKRADLGRAFAAVPAGATSLVLSHAVDLVEDGRPPRRDHVPRRPHACRADRAARRLPARDARLGRPRVRPRILASRRHARLHIRAGAGVAGLPLRYNTRSEVVTLTLQHA